MKRASMAKQRAAMVTATALAAALIAAIAVVAQPGCSASRCSFDEDEPDKPFVSIECPGGEVCYQGICRKSCNSLSDGTMPCTSDGDCPGAIPNCVASGDLTGSFCSACEST